MEEVAWSLLFHVCVMYACLYSS